MKTGVWSEDGQSKEETSKHKLKRGCERKGLGTAAHQYFSIHIGFVPLKHLF